MKIEKEMKELVDAYKNCTTSDYQGVLEVYCMTHRADYEEMNEEVMRKAGE